MKLSEYKEMLLNQDLLTLDRELKYFSIIKAYDNLRYKNRKSYNEKEEDLYKTEEGKSIENTVTIEGLGTFSFSIYKSHKEERFQRTTFIYKGRREFRHHNLKGLLIYAYCPLLRSYDVEIISYGMSYDKEKFIKNINKKWDKYFENLEKTLDKICGSPLEEVFFDNYSNKWQQSNATVFSGPRGKAILWTTVSGGYNIQQKHIRMFCKPLTPTHIVEFNIQFKD